MNNKWSGVGVVIGGGVAGGTSGSVLFVSSTGTLAQDNANFFWDDANNRLGLGTASPSTTLHVTRAAGSATLSTFEMTGTPTGDTYISILAPATTGSGSNFIQGKVNNVEMFNIDGAGGGYFSGAVGVGIDGASAHFAVVTPAVGTKAAFFRGAASQTASVSEWQNSAGTAYVTVGPPTLPGNSTTVNFLNITGTMPTTMSVETDAVLFDITSAGSSSSNNRALDVIFRAGYTGAKRTVGAQLHNLVNGTGTDPFRAVADVNYGSFCISEGTTSGTRVGSLGYADSGNVNYGLFGEATVAKNSATNIGIAGFGLNTGTTPIQVGGYFGLQAAAPTYASAALMCDNSSTTSDIFVARDNGAEKFVIEDAGTVDMSGISAGVPNFRITATSDSPTVTWGAAAGNEASTTPAGYLEITVGGNARYIPFWA